MFRLGLLTLTLSAAALAQTIPGTFTPAPQPSGSSDQPLVTTPTLTLSNGFSPATINMSQTLMSEQPENMASGMPQNEGTYSEVAAANPPQPSETNFNFGSASQPSAFNFGMASLSLGEFARQFKAGHVQAHKTYTNEDIDRLTSEVPDTGIIYAKVSNGQPIVDRNQSGFSPMSGIANMPDVSNNADGTELANDRGKDAGQQATTPSLDGTGRTTGNDTNQQLPASDNPR
jgi:hypothetical protein